MWRISRIVVGFVAWDDDRAAIYKCSKIVGKKNVVFDTIFFPHTSCSPEGFVCNRVIFKRRLMDLPYSPQRGVCTIVVGMGEGNRKKIAVKNKQTEQKKKITHTHRHIVPVNSGSLRMCMCIKMQANKSELPYTVVRGPVLFTQT